MKRFYEIDRVVKKVDGVNISYYELGEGREGDILLIHGPWHNAASMYDYAYIWANTHHVVVIDLPDHYQDFKDKVTDFDKLVTIMNQFICSLQDDGVIGKKPMLQGWSIGGCVALGLASAYPDLLDKIVLLCSMHDTTTLKFPYIKNKFTRNAFEFLAINLNKSENAISDQLRRLNKYKNDYLAPVSGCQSDSMMLKNINLTDDLSKIKISVYALYGGKDTIVNESIRRSTIEKMPDMTYVVNPAFAHMCINQVPEDAYLAVWKLLNK